MPQQGQTTTTTDDKQARTTDDRYRPAIVLTSPDGKTHY